MLDYRCGYIDKTGKFVIEPKFSEALLFSEGLACVKVDNLYGFIDKSGSMVIEPRFINASSFSEGYARIRDGFGYGFIDKRGVVRIKPQFRIANHFHDGLCLVSKDDKWGYIDKSGSFVINPIFGDASDFIEGFARVTYVTDNQTGMKRWGFIDTKGKFLVPPIDKFYLGGRTRGFSEGLAPIVVGGSGPLCVDDKVGYIDRSGRFVIEPQFLVGNMFSEGLAYVERINNGVRERGYINNLGNLVFTLDDGLIHPCRFGDGLALVLDRSQKAGYIDKEGKLVIDTTLDGTLGFSEGLASVKINGKYGFIDKTGKVVIKPQFEEVSDFTDGYAWVKVACVTPDKMPQEKQQRPKAPVNKDQRTNEDHNEGCYIATAIYGSYDCPEVWTLRRYRDQVLKQYGIGRIFIKFYYAISPSLVKCFGKTKLFFFLVRPVLDRIVKRLNDKY